MCKRLPQPFYDVSWAFDKGFGGISRDRGVRKGDLCYDRFIGTVSVDYSIAN